MRDHAPALTRTMAAATLMALTGCSMVPDYHRPDPGTPARFQAEAMPLPVQAAAGGWWTDFHSAELDTLVSRALAANNDLAAATARVAQARGQARIAGAAQYPTLSLGSVADGQNADPTSSTPSDRTKGSSTFTLTGDSAYELDFWRRNRAAAQSGKALAQASVADRDTLAIATAAATVDSYMQILSLSERIRTSRQIADEARQTLTLIEARARVGTATTLQIEQQRTALAGFDAAIPVLEQQREQADHALSILLALPPRAFVPQATTLDGIALPVVEPGLPSDLLLRRPDIAAAEARLRAANFDVGVARAALLPSLSLTGTGGLGSAALGQALSSTGFLGGTATLLAPLFSGGRLKGQLHYDRARVEELTATYRQTSLIALREVEDALTARHQLELAEGASVTAVTSARHAADLARAQFRIGVIDLLTLLDTQRALYQAQNTYLQLRLARLQAAIALYRALGGAIRTPS